MHLISLNLTDLVLSLFRGTITCDAPDDKSTWDFAVFADKHVWQAHGLLVAGSTRYLPGSFDRPPRNPAEKISSGYRAWEYLLYVYGLLPALLRPHLAPIYYKHFCKLVFAVRIITQRSLPRAQIPSAQQCIIEYVEGFETIYYQGHIERLHFVRPSLHTFSHIIGEIERTGLCSLYSQWTLENYIGNITREIKQHVTPYANVSERALRRCQVNALRAMDPSFARSDRLPNGAIDLGNGFILLPPYDNTERPISAAEHGAIQQLCIREQLQPPRPGTPVSVRRWARLSLPSRQIARTAWKERSRYVLSIRILYMSKVHESDGNHIAEVQYFFQNMTRGVVTTYAMVSVFSEADPAILEDSIYTVVACASRGHLAESYEVVRVQDIVTVVAMVPLPRTAREEREGAPERFFLVEKPGLDVAFLAGHAQGLDEVDDNDM
ncbi:hypothetical protein C8Q80DRAFT_1111115 [Daedaleopsis nitida]|nr:hypothetical protein C8Q80DRAFT_1111115 [Daedaleopsis nitida]